MHSTNSVESSHLSTPPPEFYCLWILVTKQFWLVWDILRVAWISFTLREGKISTSFPSLFYSWWSSLPCSFASSPCWGAPTSSLAHPLRSHRAERLCCSIRTWKVYCNFTCIHLIHLISSHNLFQRWSLLSTATRCSHALNKIHVAWKKFYFLKSINTRNIRTLG